MKVSDGQLEQVCRPGEGAFTCSFLVFGPEGFGCAKTTSLEGLIRQRRAERSMNAMGDNCDGPPDFQAHEVAS